MRGLSLLREVVSYPVIFGIYFLRTAIVLQGHVWKDIENGILPALNCFYCVPSNGPYGVLWWIISQGLRFNYAGLSSLVDFFVMVMLRNRYPIFPVYAFMSWLLWLQAPYDLPIIWVTLLGLLRYPLVLLGPLAKLPVGAPLSVWHFILSKPYNVNDLEYYGFMGIVFIFVILQVLNSYTTKNPTAKVAQETRNLESGRDIHQQTHQTTQESHAYETGTGNRSSTT